jgi:hypothetical protein
MNVAIFWDIAQCNPYMNRSFGGTYRLHLQSRKSVEQDTSLQQVGRLNFDPEKEVIRSSETSVNMRTTLRYIPGDVKINNKPLS